MPKRDTNQIDLFRRSCGVTSATRAWVGGHNSPAKRELEKHLHGTERPPTGLIDVAFVAPASVDEALYFAGKLRSRLEKGAAIWMVLALPRENRKETTDHPESSKVHYALLAARFVSTATVALGETWQATRFDSEAKSASA